MRLRYLRILEEVRGSFIPAQDHARNSLLHVLYAPRKRLSSTLGPRAATCMRDAGYELPRIPIPRTRVNKGGLRGSVAEADGGIVAIQLPQLDHLTHRLLRRWFRPAGHVERSACKSHRPSR